MKRVALSTIVISSLLVLAGCGASQSQPPPPATTPVTPGYIYCFDHELDFGFEYPEDWEMHSPEEFTPGWGIEKVEMFTKKGEGTSITIIVKSTDWKNLEEVKKQYGEIHPTKITLKEDIIEVNRREGYEIIYKDPPMKTREVVFLVNGKAYTITYSTTEDLYAASEEIFDHIIGSFIIK